ncbi:MAG: hypothetical protein ACXVH1_29015 [Solirubrobacteraceae bacterium]
MALLTHGDRVAHVPAGLRSRLTWRALWLLLPRDGFELVLFAVFAAVSMWVVVLNLRWGAARGVVLTGIDGELPVDQMQYLAWVQDASRHLLVSDLFVVRGTAHDYLQPMVTISGGLVALGMAPWLALLVWKPVVVIATLLALRACYHRVLAGKAERRAALALGLFAAGWASLGEEWIPFLSWGYLYALAALAALVGALVAYDRARVLGHGVWQAPILGLLASWLHPWQGELLILVIAGVEVAGLRTWLGNRKRIMLAGSTIAATALPLIYYAILQHSDPAWRMAATVTKHHVWSLSGAVWPLAPLLIAAALAYRRRPEHFLGAAMRIWPPAALIIWTLSKTGLGATPLHAWIGITIPLAALAVEGVSTLRWRRVPGHQLLGAIVVAILTIPASIHLMRTAHAYIDPSTHNQNLISTSERQAFRYLARDPQPGSVLSSYTLADVVPAETGRRTYGGDYRWSGPHFATKEDTAWRLLHGQLPASPARAFVLSAGARFVLADCSSHARLARILTPIVLTIHRFGCATVYEISRNGHGV